MQAWEVDAVLVRFQLRRAPSVARRLAGRGGGARLLRSVMERKEAARSATSPRREGQPRLPEGYDEYRYFVRVDEEGVLNPDGDTRIVGAPGDRFRLRRDVVRFFAHALGGFRNYRWALNPRRRRRVRGRPPRWVMHANHGLLATANYRIVRAMAGWAGRMDASRNWAALFPRPVTVQVQWEQSQEERRMRAAVWALVRRVIGPGVAAFFAVSTPAELRRRFYTPISTTRGRSGRSSQQPLPAAPLVGSFSDEGHLGVFVAHLQHNAGGDSVLRVDVLDPHARNSFDPRLGPMLRRALREALARMGVPEKFVRAQVRMVSVPVALQLQYGREGSCGPSSLALMLSALREVGKVGPAAHKLPADLPHRIFRGVTDEDVVIAAQLTHSAAV
jgi:hypothetical protein